MPTRPPTFIRFFCLPLIACGSGCNQPVPNCTSAHGPYAAQYTLVDGDPNSACGQLRGDVLGMQTYFQAGGPNGTPNYRDAKVAIKPQSLGLLIEHAATYGTVAIDDVFHDASAIGEFSAGFPNEDTFCHVPEFADARVALPEVPAIPDDPTTPDVDESLPAQPALDVSYEWSNARFVVSADAQGTQFEADLTYTQDACTAVYHVVAVYPAVGCATDNECNNEKNGINPDFAVRCDAEIGLCVLDGELPAYK